MTTSNHKNNISSTRTSEKKSTVKSSSSRTNQKSTIEVNKSTLTKTNF